MLKNAKLPSLKDKIEAEDGLVAEVLDAKVVAKPEGKKKK